MTDRPDMYPDYALDDILDPISGQPNVIEPPTIKKQQGWLFKEHAEKPWMNWIHRYTRNWIAYLDERLNKPESYTIGTLPSAASVGAGAFAYVTNDIDGAVPAFSDGTNWRRVTDRAIVSLI
jgi:hypothetical protein